MTIGLSYLCGWVMLWYEIGLLLEHEGGRRRLSVAGRKVRIEDRMSAQTAKAAARSTLFTHLYSVTLQKPNCTPGGYLFVPVQAR